MNEYANLVALLVGGIKSYSQTGIQKFIREQVNLYGCAFLYNSAPSKREFYGKIFFRSSERITEDEVLAFLRLQKGLQRRPSFIITIAGYTKDAQTIACNKGILLFTFEDLARHTRLDRLPTAEWKSYDIKFLP